MITLHEKDLLELLRYIDRHIEEPLTATGIARQAGYSPYHFSRMFTARMGVSVMDYVRGRKLAFAVPMLLRGERVVDVAAHLGFSSHEGFTRAFRRVYQQTPTAYRAVVALPYQVAPPRIPTQKKEVKEMNVTFETRPEKKTIGYLLHTTPGSAEIPAFWQAVMADERWARLVSKAGGANYGLCIHPETMEEGKMDYMIAFDWDGVSAPDADMEFFTVPAATYAVFDTSEAGPELTGIRPTWNYIYTEWFPDSGYRYDGDKPDFEVYDDKSGCWVYIPVVPEEQK